MIWARIGELFASAASGVLDLGAEATANLSALLERVRTTFVGDPETRRKVAFSIAMIALSAKMAKADGVVTVDEVAAFERLFDIPEEERRNVARVYDIAKSDVAGFEGYAMQLAALCDSSGPNCPMLQDILDGLFHIAKADGVLHEAELGFLARTAEIFSIDEATFDTIAARHVADDTLGGPSPRAVLGLAVDASAAEAERRYRDLVREAHPDRAIARGLPEEFVAIATERVAAYNDAIASIRAMEAA